jgi:MoaA/NifB/PqqE/SkfB family radical SAM enzyme
MCFASRNRKQGQNPLTPGEIRSVWEQAKKLGALASVIEGGEATLRPDLLDIVDAVEGKKNICNLITNAIDLDKSFIQRLKSAGLSSICFSLDGPDPESNDKVRGHKGHYEQVMRCIQWSKEIGLDVHIAPTFSHGELPKVKRIIQLAMEKKCRVSASTAVLSGRWAGQHGKKLNGQEWGEIREILHNNPKVRFDWNINYSMRYECPGGREKICVGIYGDVQGCATNPISFGNVRDLPLHAIWNRMRSFEPFQKRSPVCLVSEDENYIATYVDPISEQQEYPVDIDQHPLGHLT